MRYIFKDDPLPIKNAKSADAQKIGEALEALAVDAGGDLTPKAVVTAARDPRHVLHPHFDWDDAIAADKFRQEQARAIIRCIRVEDGAEEEPVRAFLSVADKGGVSYRTVKDVQSSSSLQIAVLKAAERDFEAWEKRLRDITEICDLVRKARTAVRKRREKLETRPCARRWWLWFI